MTSEGWRAVGQRVLEQAYALRAAYPDPAAMRAVAVPDLGPVPPGGDGEAAAYAVLGFLRDEMVLVRDGRADSLAVLDDELACARRRLGLA